MTLRSSDLQSDSDLDRIRNYCDFLLSAHFNFHIFFIDPRANEYISYFLYFLFHMLATGRLHKDWIAQNTPPHTLHFARI